MSSSAISLNAFIEERSITLFVERFHIGKIADEESLMGILCISQKNRADLLSAPFVFISGCCLEG